MPADKRNLMTAKAMGLIFHCSMLLRPERCLLAYRSTYNAFFMDLPVSFFVSHSSLLTAKGVAGACDTSTFDAVRMGSPVIIILIYKKLTNKCTNNWNFQVE